MLLIGCQAPVAAVLGGITGEQHAIDSRWGSKAIVVVGTGRMEVEGKQKISALEYEHLVVGMLIGLVGDDQDA